MPWERPIPERARPPPSCSMPLLPAPHGFQPAPAQPTAKSAEAPATPDKRLQQARQYLKNGNGCQAENLLNNFPASSYANEAGQLLPLATFMCRGGGNLGGNPEVQSLYGQASSAMQRREPSAALYNLLVALNQEPEGRKEKARGVMQGIFVLLGDSDTLVQQYKKLI